MDTSRISFGEMVAAVSGLVLFIVMFMPWFGVSADFEGVGTTSVDANAWESFGFIDIVLFLVALLAIGAALARAAGAVPPELPAPLGMIVAAGGVLAVLLILYRLIDTPGESVSGFGAEIDVGRKVGAFLGLIAAGGVAFGGYTAATEREGGRSPFGPGARPPAA